MASFGTAAGDGTTDDTAALQAIINGMVPGATLTLESGKTYLVTSLALKAHCRFVGSATVKLKNSTNPMGMLVLARRVTVEGLTLDGNRANNSGTFGNAVVYGLNAPECTLHNLTIEEAAYNGVFIQSSPYTVVDGCTVDGSDAEAIFLYKGCSYSRVTGNTILNCLDDGIKIHSNAAAEIAATLFDVAVTSNVIDYRGVTLPAESLAIEIYRNTPPESGGGEASGFLVDDNVIWGPDGVGTAQLFGISMGGPDDALVSNNVVHGPNINIGYENAGGEDIVFDTNTLDGFTLYGYSISQAGAARTLIDNATVSNAASASLVYGVQFHGGGPIGQVRNSVFTDAGERAVFFNDSGDGGEVVDCQFSTVAQAATMTSVYIFTANNVTITGNVGTSGSGTVAPPLNSGGTGITESGNVWS